MTRYAESQRWLKRALEVIPLGAQTYSKSRTQYPEGVSPHFAVRAAGSTLWDVDGNAYLDFVNGLAAVTLGYQDPDVTAAVRAQLDVGTIFSLSHVLEVEVAEAIRARVPCAEMVRFGKNGSDATTAAIRLARAYTGREHVALCGYHGWHDWSIGATTRHRGVPEAVRALTHLFTYNDLASLETVFKARPGQVAAVILEPMSATPPAKGFLEGVRDLAHREGAVLVFDETITGFRFAVGGAQEFFGVTPDLATFGKGLANGYPISALAGRKSLMGLLEDVFFSMTFAGETLSLAAARATLEKLTREPVIETLRRRGQAVMDGLRERIKGAGLEAALDVTGHPSWSFLLFKDVAGHDVWDLKTFFLQEMFTRGILTVGTHNMSYAHTDADVEQLLKAYDEVLSAMSKRLKNHTLAEGLRCVPLRPLFRVR